MRKALALEVFPLPLLLRLASAKYIGPAPPRLSGSEPRWCK
jgi:hypothetical protein